MSSEVISEADHKMARAVEAMERDFQGLLALLDLFQGVKDQLPKPALPDPNPRPSQ